MKLYGWPCAIEVCLIVMLEVAEGTKGGLVGMVNFVFYYLILRMNSVMELINLQSQISLYFLKHSLHLPVKLFFQGL